MERRSPNLLLAALLGWLVPGAGHYLVLRMRAKGAFYFVLITGTYLAGLVMSGFIGVNYERFPIHFAAYVWNGLTTFVTMVATSSLKVKGYNTQEQLGTLYILVASLLNLLAVLDIFGCVERAKTAEATP